MPNSIITEDKKPQHDLFAIAALTPAQTKYLPIVVAIALFMQILDSTVLNTALPAMAHDLNQPALSMQWTVISYALTLAIFTPVSGFIADKYIGNRNAILAGGSLMALGQLLLFFSASTFSSDLGSAKGLMWLALFIIIFGNGFFKPNISSMVGSLYPKQEKSKLDSAFTIFYMGINIGAFLGQFICPYSLIFVYGHKT